MKNSSKKKIDFLKNKFFGVKLSKLEGNILELGYDNGNNFKYYKQSSNITAIDKKKLIIQKYNNITIIQQDISNEIPFDNNQFDYVVFSFFLCTVSNKNQIINEIYRILKPNGLIIYLEHISSNNFIYHSTQILLSPLTKIFFSGCSLNNNFKLYLKKKFKLIEIKQIDNYIEPYEYAVWKKQST